MIYIILGPTAVGKTTLALSLAKKLNADIINADAFQVYKELDIGTAKIKEEEMLGIKHHLLSYVEPNEPYSVARYQKDFREVVFKIKDKDIVVVGGTGLYVRAAIMDYNFSLEQKVDLSKFEKMDNDELYNYLLSIDEESAKKLHKNNRRRVLRAISIYLENGETKSSIIDKQEHKYIYDDIKIFNIEKDRKELYESINKRVDLMFEKGLINEVKTLLDKYGRNIQAFNAIGYKEVVLYLDNKISLEECKELIKKNTRNYAKRQITFFKHQFKCINISSLDDILISIK